MLTFTTEMHETYPIALLIKATSFDRAALIEHYVAPLVELGIEQNELVAFTLVYPQDKISMREMKAELEQLLPQLADVRCRFLYVADANYFKALTKKTRTEPHHGYVLPCALPGFERLQVVLGVNYQALIYNPAVVSRLTLSLKTLAQARLGSYRALGATIIHEARYPTTPEEIAVELEALLAANPPRLAVDIEGFSLSFDRAGIGTIAFAPDCHHGIAFACDYAPVEQQAPTLSLLTSESTGPSTVPAAQTQGTFIPNPSVRALLRSFFERYPGTLVFHYATYDLKALVFHLFMDGFDDHAGFFRGFKCLTGTEASTAESALRFEDTRLVAYLATNSCAGNQLSLKHLAHEFAGNWAIEAIGDIGKIPLQQLLQYNLVDALSTQWVHDRYWPQLVADDQELLYQTLFLPAQRLLVPTEMTGLPLIPERVQALRSMLEAEVAHHQATIAGHELLHQLEDTLTAKAYEADYAVRRSKAKNPEKILTKDWALFRVQQAHRFNPASSQQVIQLVYEKFGLPVIDKTETGLPATGAETLKKLVVVAKANGCIAKTIELLEALIGLANASKILSAFVPAFEAAVAHREHPSRRWLHGSFLIGGCVSGRKSSSDPNLQNLPSNPGKPISKPVKECFSAPEGWIFCGADFQSLEDMVNALVTKDPAKLKVYEDHYDGHSLRAFAYFGDQMPDIEDTVESINSIDERYPVLRQDSKGPTFALTYGGTFRTLVRNLGWPEAKARQVEERYHELYDVSAQWVKAKIAQAAKDGYGIGAFGLRIRAPLLGQVLWNRGKVPFEAQAEARTLGNAISGQSYGLLTSRAAVAFFEKVWASPYAHDIWPVAEIHDAIYLLVRDDVDVVEFANRELVAAMRWQGLPELMHDEVKLGAELELFWPDWAHPIALPPDGDAEAIRARVAEVLEARKAAA